MLNTFTIVAGSLSLLSLFLLHFTSPEFKPGWRMISEYALGRYKWLITAFFLLWALSTFFLCAALLPQIHGFWTRLALLLLFVSGVGELMGGLFDVKHKLHGLAFATGIPTLPVAALILSYNLFPELIYMAHLTWISVLLMAASMMVFFSGLKKAGIAFGPDAPPLDKIPPGVIAVNGIFNRILVLIYVLWLIMAGMGV